MEDRAAADGFCARVWTSSLQTAARGLVGGKSFSSAKAIRKGAPNLSGHEVLVLLEKFFDELKQRKSPTLAVRVATGSCTTTVALERLSKRCAIGREGPESGQKSVALRHEQRSHRSQPFP